MVEAMWHGVPVVGVTLFADNEDNLTRVTSRGAGLTLSKTNLSRKSLTAAIQNIITDKKVSFFSLVILSNNVPCKI